MIKDKNGLKFTMFKIRKLFNKSRMSLEDRNILKKILLDFHDSSIDRNKELVEKLQLEVSKFKQLKELIK